MALTTSAWDGKKTELNVIQAYTESALVPDSAFMRAQGAEAQTVFPNVAARTATNAADGTAALAIASNTDTATTLSADTPLKVWEYIPYSNINTSPVNFINSYSTRLGSDLREGHDQRIVALGAITAAATGTTVLFDDEGTGSAVVAALKDTVVQFDTLKTPQLGRYCFLSPVQMGKLFDVSSIRSGDFISGADNVNNLIRLNFMGMTVISGNFVFNVDHSSNTNFASKYRANFAGAQPVWGVAWHNAAYAVQYFEPVNVKDSAQDVYESMLITARVHMGTAVVRNTNFIRIRGDA
jgi:hypothetical protein